MNSTLYLDKKLVVFDSDDWGMLGIRDLEGFESLKKKGYELGKENCDYYSIELPEDMERLYSILGRHRDSVGLPPVFSCNFIVARPDYEKIIKTGFREFHFLDLSQRLPGLWKNRDQLLNAYKEGVRQGLVYPGYHGFCHFNYNAWLAALRNGENDLHDCIKEHISYIPSLHRDIFNYEYLERAKPSIYLPLSLQEEKIKKGVKLFQKIFGFSPVVTAAPKCTWNRNTEKIWHKYGIRYICAANRHVNTASHNRLGEKNRWGMIYLTRNVNFEPVRKSACPDAFIEIDFLLNAQQPAIIETHSINFHSSIKNYRDQSLQKLDRLLCLIEEKHPDIVYLTSRQFGEILEKGYCYLRNGERLEVNIHKTDMPYRGRYYLLKKKTSLKRYFRATYFRVKSRL